MKNLLTITATLVLILSLAAFAGTGDQDLGSSTQPLPMMGASADESGQIVPGQYIVVMKSSRSMGKEHRSPAMAAAAAEKVQQLAASVGAEADHYYSSAIDGFAGKLTDAQVEQLKNDPAVDFIEPDRTAVLLAQTTPWGIDHVKAPLAQANGHNGSTVKVGVIDTGIDYLHPDLAALYAGGYDFYWNDIDPMDQQGHGTHVSGTIAGIDNTIGVLGVAPAVSLYAIKVFGTGGSTQWSIVVAAIDWAVANGMDVVNMSLGGGGGSLALQAACDNAYASGMLLVAAAGNSGGWVLWPARYPSVIAVSAIDQNNNLAYFSSRGPEIEVTAPGVRVLSTWPHNRYVQLPGTSMAAPHVTGVVSLIIGTGNYATAIDVRNRLTSTCVDLGLPGRDNLFGFGLPDAQAATGLTPNAPVVNYTATPVAGCTPMDVSFTDQTWGAPTSWLWDFGDGTTSTLQHPSHTYATDGNYDITLTASNAVGSDQLAKPGYIVVGGPQCSPPVADFGAIPETGCAPFQTQFWDISSGGPTSWLWDFGDGTTSILQHPPHTYAAGGAYSVSLTVTNPSGSSTATKVDYIVADPLPGVDFSADQTTGYPPLTVNFSDLTSANPTNWFWDFGDFGSSNLQNPTVVFDKPGDYKVILRAFNACGSGELIREAFISVVEGGGGCNTPVTAFSGTPTAGVAPLTVAFTDQSTNTPFAWNWTFGDLASSNVQNPTHTYTAAGTYTVVLTSGNTCGENTSTQTGYITVTDPGCTAPVAGFSGTPTAGNSPLTVSFTDQSTNSPTGWAWDFGDGTTSAAQNPSHTYTAAGTYNVSLTATNACGSNQSIQANYVTVTDPGCTVPPVAGFAGTPTSGGAPLTVDFADQSTNIPTGWSWDFGDGGTSTAQNPSHVYTSAGSYTVSLTATNACGSNQSVATNYITVTGGCTAPPTAGFSGTPTTGFTPLTVSFTDLSTGSPDSWQWKFGDGGRSTLQNPSHIYTQPGNYKVVLRVSNACGKDKLKIEDYIIVPEGQGGQGLAFDDELLPQSPVLEQNYPNPFNPTTDISFTLPQSAYVTLEIYNIAGQQVDVLVSGQMGSGRQTVQWNASDHPSGIYLYRLTTDTYTETRKMLLIK